VSRQYIIYIKYNCKQKGISFFPQSMAHFFSRLIIDETEEQRNFIIIHTIPINNTYGFIVDIVNKRILI